MDTTSVVDTATGIDTSTEDTTTSSDTSIEDTTTNADTSIEDTTVVTDMGSTEDVGHPFCPPPAPYTGAVGGRVADLQVTLCDGTPIGLHELCGADVGLIYNYYGW